MKLIGDRKATGWMESELPSYLSQKRVYSCFVARLWMEMLSTYVRGP